MIKNIIFILSLTLVLCNTALSQNLIGYSKAEIKAYIAQNEPNFELTDDKKGVGLLYKIYNNDEEGRIFLIEENGLCYSYQMAFSYSKLNSVISDLNAAFVKVGDYEWLDYTSTMTYKLNLIKEKSLFIVQRSIHKTN